MKKVLFVALLAAGFSGIAQDIMPTTAAAVQASLKQQAAMQASSLVKNLPFTQIGPTVMSGRVVDVAVNPDKPAEFYVGYASGGLWYTNNNGTSFSPLMDNAPTQNVGDIAVDWASGTIWVGTGENNSSRSSYAGIGLLKSTDQGSYLAAYGPRRQPPYWPYLDQSQQSRRSGGRGAGTPLHPQ